MGLAFLLACAPAKAAREVTAARRAKGDSAAVATMAAAFNGRPLPGHVREQVDRAFALYGEKPSEDSYRRAGGVLVMLREQFGVDEMAILAHMNEARWLGEDFRSAAALSCSALMPKPPS